MTDATLVIGTRRYSSWSMRGWLAVRLAGLAVTDEVIALREGASAIAGRTPANLVPFLRHDGAEIWESLAICEYCAEHAPGLWPADRVARAAARSVAAEMHSGFRALRIAMPMNLGRDRPLAAGIAPDVAADIARVDAIFAAAAAPFLYAEGMGMADAMFAPVVARLLSYHAPLSSAAAAYCRTVRQHPLVAEWYALAAAEPAAWQLPKYEDVP